MPTDNSYGDRQRRNAPQQPMPDVAGRLVPRATDFEASVLGALMLEKDAFSQVCDLLSPESFYEPRHAVIYNAIQMLGLKQEPIDLMTVTQSLRRTGDLEKVGGAAYIANLSSNVVSAAHIEFHARIVAQKYLARQLIGFATNIENGAFDESNDIDDLLQEAESRLFEISQRNLKREVMQIDPIIQLSIDKIKAASTRNDGISGIATGFPALDKITSGWQNSDLIIIAARPAMGKTAFVLSMALNVAMHNDPVAVFSLEMSNVQLVNRLISNACEMPGDKIKSGKLTDAEWVMMMNRMQRLQGLPLYVDDTSGLSMLELRTKARRLVREHDIKLIVIDYLQLMTAGVKLGSREQEVSTISRSLKELAKELNIPIIALSQLNRKVEDRGNKDKRPQLSDLRESGAIEQDADIVCFIHRPEYYTKSATDDKGHNIVGKVEFIIAKHRSGAVDDVNMFFRKEYVRFENWDETTQNQYGSVSAIDNEANAATAVAPANPEQAAADTAALGLGPNAAFMSDETEQF